MKKILFFVDKEWSLGRFHSDLIKYLFSRGIDAQLLDYRRSYWVTEIEELTDVYDYFVTTYHGVDFLHNDYNVPIEKCKVILYHEHDAREFIKKTDYVQKVASVATVSRSLLRYSEEMNRTIHMCQFGINTNTFKLSIPKSLSIIGFAGQYLTRQQTEELRKTNNIEAKSFKRGYLAQEIAQELRLPFMIANEENSRSTFISMPGFYNKIDCILCCSEDEGAGGPVLEGGAAGRLILTTNVGTYSAYVSEQGAIGLSVDENDFKTQAKDILSYYIKNPGAFRDKCADIRQFALAKYDLSNYIDDWVQFLEN